MIALIKAFHLVLVMILLTIPIVLLFLNLKKPQDYLDLRHKMLRLALWLLGLLGLSGSLLVHPRHFTFHTPWILAAYFLVFIGAILIQYPYRQYKILGTRNLPLSSSFLWLERGTLILSFVLFIGIIHDAVTKQTFI